MSPPAARPATARRVALRSAIPGLGFLAYAVAVWLVPVGAPRAVAEARAQPGLPSAAAVDAWRAAGCQACHSIHGLGGHTGPDLTNIRSRRTEAYIRAMLIAGPPGMPSYRDLDPAAADHILEYLAAVDLSGRYPAPSWLGGDAPP